MMDHGKKLPPITLSNTTISYLVTFIPLLVSMTTHGDVPRYDDERDKPAWWPKDIQWRNPKSYTKGKNKDCLQVLRKLVHSCYSYHGVEELLCRLDEVPEESEQQETIEIIELSDNEDGVEESSGESEGPVFVCCFCLEQFSSHEAVHSHQNTCKNRSRDSGDEPQFSDWKQSSTLPPDQLYIDSFLDQPPASETEGDSPSLSSHVSRLDDSFLTQAPKNPQSHLSASSVPPNQVKKGAPACPQPFVPTLKTRSQKKLDQIMEKHNQRQMMMKECREMREVPETGAWWVSRTRRHRGQSSQHPGTYLSKEAFLAAMGMIRKAEVQMTSNCGPKPEQEVDLDCEIVNVEGPLSAVPPAPFEKSATACPRSARSLMSQLSRGNEVSSRTRRLSFCFVEDEWADKEALEEGRDPLHVSLLTLDVSSPLGQRIKKYVKGEGHMNIIKDVESYCRTEIDEDSYSKLRFRASDFRVTFRKKRRATTYVHKYKFNSSDRLEFKTYLRTGLSPRSRQLQHCLPKCHIVLKELTKSEIKHWTEEKKIRITENIVYDDDICITQIDIPESKLCQRFSQEKNGIPVDMYTSSQSPSSFLQNSSHRPKPVNSRPAFASHMPSSPPHVPNIFRNRLSHTPSPPRLVPNTLPSRPKLSNGLHFNENKFVNRRDGLGVGSPLRQPISTHSRIAENSMSKAQHLSRHPLQSPSVYSSAGLPVNERRSTGLSITGQNRLAGPSSRRKQLMTYVRRDECEGGAGQLVSNSSFGYIPLGGDSNHPGTNNNHLSMNSNHLSMNNNHLSMNNTDLPVKNSTLEQKKNGTHVKNVRRLSNFDYFRIRDSKISSGQSAVNPSVLQSPTGPAVTFNHSPQNHRHSQTAAGLANQRALQAKTDQVRTNSLPQHRPKSNDSNGPHTRDSSAPSQQNAASNGSKPVNPRFNHVQEVIGKSPCLMEHFNNTVSVPSSMRQVTTIMSLCPNPNEDGEDEVMEIICIDDD
ncbi:unnamed protein product [Lymnaea stagnalis]|uniref:Nuclear respiratory factor 1 NLS/DNA-binding dimerisation domain-containing protein n=1 Tax=Lymnaea stagnalis TaxID=6523 RepID=A0AAV2H073_LYMST